MFLEIRRFPCTMLLLGSLVLYFAVELATGAIGNDARLLALGAMPDTAALGHDYWRLLSYAWLHAGYGHLAANGVLLWWVGRIVERRVRSLLVFGFYLVCVLAGGLIILWHASAHPKPGVSLGASAAVSGLLTCALVLLYRPAAALFGQQRKVRLALLAVLACGIAVSFLPGVSLVAHLEGFALGAIFGLLVPLRRFVAAPEP